MTPKQKAIELVDMFIFEHYATHDYAKQCALIAVQMIINDNPHSNPLNTNVYSTMQYWQDVKQEIEKL